MKLKQALVSLVLVGGTLTLAVAYAQQANSAAKEQAAKAPAAAKTGGKLTVNGVLIPPQRLETIAKAQTSQGQPDTPELRANVREQLINFEVISQEALKEGLDKTPEVKDQMEMARQQILVRAFQQHYVKVNPVKDEVLKSEYERLKGQLGEKEYKPQHILVPTEAEAKLIIEELGKGADFDKLAKEKSVDQGSKDNGGKLDWSTPPSFVPPFSEAMVKLAKGETTKVPVKSQFGYHVIRMEDIRPLKAPGFDEVKENIRQGKQQQDFAALVKDLRAKAKVEDK